MRKSGKNVAQHFALITPEHQVMDIDQGIIMPDGSTRWQQWRDRAIFDPDGRVVEYLSVGRDISEQKVAEEALHLASKKLILLYSITRHDINNPLTVLVGYPTILKKKQPDPSFTEYFLTVSTAAQRIASMIQFTREYESIGVKAPVWQDTRTLADTAAKEAPLGKVMVKKDLPVGAEVFADPLFVRVFTTWWTTRCDTAGRSRPSGFRLRNAMVIISWCAKTMAMVSLQMKKRRSSNADLGRTPGLVQPFPGRSSISPASLSAKRVSPAREHGLR